jgi:hypothetical protein
VLLQHPNDLLFRSSVNRARFICPSFKKPGL